MNTPTLDLLLSGYFHQDWTDEFGDVWQAVDHFLADSSSAHDLASEIETLLSVLSTDDEVDDFLASRGCEFTPRDVGLGAHLWLAEVAHRATGHAAGRPMRTNPSDGSTGT